MKWFLSDNDVSERFGIRWLSDLRSGPVAERLRERARTIFQRARVSLLSLRDLFSSRAIKEGIARARVMSAWASDEAAQAKFKLAVQDSFVRQWGMAQDLKTAAFSRIGLQLGLAANVLLLAVLTLIGGTVLREQRILLMNEMQAKCDLFVKSLSIVVREAYYPRPDMFFLGYLAEETLKEGWVLKITLFDRQGRVILEKERPDPPADPDLIKLQRPILLKDLTVGSVEMVFSLAPVKEAQRKVAWRLGLISLIAIAAGLLLIVGGVPVLVKPIFELSRAAEKVREGSFDIQVPHSGTNEISMLAQNFNAMVRGLKEREVIRTSFGRYFSPSVARAILEGSVALAGERKNVTLLLMDIRGFTTLSEKLSPEATVQMLNDFFSEMVQIIHQYQGTVDKFMGDAILAVFGAPISFENHAFSGLTCATEMLKAVTRFNAARAGSEKPPVKIGIALNTGEVVAGNLGTQERTEYTVIGDAVNTVARMEGLNKKLGTSLLVSRSTYLPNQEWFSFQPLGKHQLRGRQEPIELFTMQNLAP